MNSWVSEAGVTSDTLVAHERFLRAHADDLSKDSRDARKKASQEVVGSHDQFSEIARVERAAKAHATRVQNAATPRRSSSDVPVVTGVSLGGRRLQQALRFKA